MSFATRVAHWFRAMGSADVVDDEMRREMAAHLAMEADELERSGMTAEEAHRVARLRFGGVERHKEAVRDERGTRVLGDFTGDLRLAVRSIRQRRLYTLGVVVTLAVGIGATTAVFGWADWLLYQRIPGVFAPRPIVPVVFDSPTGGSIGVSMPVLAQLRASSPLLRHAVGFESTPVQLDRSTEAPRDISANLVVDEYFSVLGVKPILGRVFTTAELAPTADPHMVILSGALWKSHYGGSPSIIGQTVRLSGVPFTVIGVLPDAFRGVQRDSPVDVWLPANTFPVLQHQPDYSMVDPAHWIISSLLIPRDQSTKPTDIIAAIRRVTDPLAANDKSLEIYSEYLPIVDGEVGTNAGLLAARKHATRLLFGVVLMVLLIATANSANLLLLRAAQRRDEFALRRALGASAGRIVRQYVVEALVLAACGVVAGLAFAWLFTRPVGTLGSRLLPIPPHGMITARTVLFAVVLCIATAVLFALVPAAATLRQGRATDLRSAARRHSSSRSTIRTALTFIQIGAAVTLIAGAILLVQTLGHLRVVELGFVPQNVSTFSISTYGKGYSHDRMNALRRETVEWLSGQPGLGSVAQAPSAPFSGGYEGTDWRPVGYTGKKWPLQTVGYHVSADFFRTLGIPLIAGRTFRQSEIGDSLSDAVILSRDAARALFGNANAVGAHVEERGFGTVTIHTVIGIVGATRSTSLRKPTAPASYLPTPSDMDIGATFIVKSTLPVPQLTKLAQQSIGRLDPTLAVAPVRLLSNDVERTFNSERLFSSLLVMLATMAAVLAGVGVYSVVAYSVSQRTREIGIRVALGAGTSHVVSLVVRQGALLVIPATLIGIGGGLIFARTLRAMLFGVTPSDPATFVVAGSFAIGIGITACLLPARSIAKVDPVTALRSE